MAQKIKTKKSSIPDIRWEKVWAEVQPYIMSASEAQEFIDEGLEVPDFVYVMTEVVWEGWVFWARTFILADEFDKETFRFMFDAQVQTIDDEMLKNGFAPYEIRTNA